MKMVSVLFLFTTFFYENSTQRILKMCYEQTRQQAGVKK